MFRKPFSLEDGTTVALASVMAAELTIPKQRVRKANVVTRALPSRRWTFKRTAITCCIALVALAVAAVIPAGIHVYTSYRDFGQLIDQQIAGGYLKGHAGLYAAPRVIETGSRLSLDDVVSSLQKAGYARNAASNIWSGSYEVAANQIKIMPRRDTRSYEWAQVSFNKNGVVAISTNTESGLRAVALEPELLTVDASLKTGQQQTVTFPEIPPVMVQAILAIEDRRFFEHNGVDLHGISRAFLNWISNSFKVQQGGSTITQQLVKNTYLTPEKTLERKFNEAMLALALEQRLSKQDIFALYCNEVYLGQRNGVAVRGIGQAARVYFGKDLKDISISEAATIAGMIQSPARYAPDRHPEAAKSRRDQVIRAMARNGAIDSQTAEYESGSPLNLSAFAGETNGFAPYYFDSVNRAIDAASSDDDSEFEQNLRVQTTIDPDLQRAAENALRKQLDQLSKTTRRNENPQGALVALDVHTGKVLAMVGGRNYAESQLNRATDAKRQPGSVFKPFVYAAAFDSGISPLATSRDAPQDFQYGNRIYSPANYGKAYSMHDVLLREGLVRSLNVVTVDVALRTGLSRVANTAERFGLPRPKEYPSMALGTFEVTPLQIAAAYAAFANGGTMNEPTVFAGAVDNTGEQHFQQPFTTRQVVTPATAYLITDILSDVIKRGTARRAKTSFSNVAIAGKTGTSRDGWFVGYTPNLVCAVWIGYDDNEQLGLTGAEAALPAWVDFMKDAISLRPSLGGESFSKPREIVAVRIDPESGDLAGPDCPSSQVVNTSYRFAPGVECQMHLPVVEGEFDESSLEPEISAEPSGLEDESESEVDKPTELPIEAESNPKSTEIEINERGRTGLVSEPVMPARTGKKKPD